jgi:hypothetical protein
MRQQRGNIGAIVSGGGGRMSQSRMRLYQAFTKPALISGGLKNAFPWNVCGDHRIIVKEIVFDACSRARTCASFAREIVVAKIDFSDGAKGNGMDGSFPAAPNAP